MVRLVWRASNWTPQVGVSPTIISRRRS